MKKNYSKLWQATLGQLELSTSTANFNTWLKTLELVNINNSTAEISAPNFINKSYVETKFYNDILNCLRQLNKDISSIKFTVKKPTKNSALKVEQGMFSNKVPKKYKTKHKPTPTNVINEKLVQTSIQSNYTFNNFVVGSSNRLAFSAAQLVVEKPGQSYNPLFLYGPAGVGKTHLMWAVRNEIVKNQPNFSAYYVTSEQFTSDYVNAIRRGEEFTNKYRQVDVLLVDDMQFIAGKEKTQEEFFHTFNSLHQNSKQIVLCSDRPPKEIPTLEERLRSRFEWGMVADIQPPDLETRIAILLDKSAQQNNIITQEVAEYIANIFKSNIRELEGALTKLVAHSRAHNTDLSLDVAMEVFQSQSTVTQLTAQKIIEKTASFYRLETADILGKKRDKEIAISRQIVMFLLREDLNLSYPKIASSLGGKDHTTIMYGSKKIEKLLKKDTDFQEELDRLREFVRS